MQNRIRALRNARGLGSTELARRAGISRQHLWAIETGRTQPTAPILLRLAEALGVQVDDLFAVPASDQPVARAGSA